VHPDARLGIIPGAGSRIQVYVAFVFTKRGEQQDPTAVEPDQLVDSIGFDVPLNP
jgi:hypothetical protein